MSYRTIGLSKWDSLQKCRKITYLLFAIVSGLRSREWESASQNCQNGFEFGKPSLNFEHEELEGSAPTSVRASGNIWAIWTKSNYLGDEGLQHVLAIAVFLKIYLPCGEG